MRNLKIYIKKGASNKCEGSEPIPHNGKRH